MQHTCGYFGPKRFTQVQICTCYTGKVVFLLLIRENIAELIDGNDANLRLHRTRASLLETATTDKESRWNVFVRGARTQV